MSDGAVVRARGLQVAYRSRRGTLPAVRSIDFEIARGEAYGLVGESGSG